MKLLSILVVLVATTGALRAAWAGGSFNDKPVTYRHSSSTSLKVTEPENFKVTVTMADGSEKADTVPALFALPDADVFLKVTVTAPDGTAWSKKVEIRSKQQAELGLTFKEEAKTQEKPANVRSFVGQVEHAGHTCSAEWGAKSLKLDFLKGGASTVVSSTQIEPKTHVNIELPQGHYDVRMYVKTNDVWDFVATTPADAQKDGWKYSWGCTKRMTKPSLVAQ